MGAVGGCCREWWAAQVTMAYEICVAGFTVARGGRSGVVLGWEDFTGATRRTSSTTTTEQHRWR